MSDQPDQHEQRTPDENAGEDELAQLRAERDEFESRWKSALADFQNFQRRSALSEQEARWQGAASVLHSIMPVLDHFDLALAHAPNDESGRRVLEGVKVIRDELIKALGLHGVSLIEPAPNADFDVMKHEAVMREVAEGVEPGRVARLLQPGYAMGERVIRPAKVAVSPTD